MPTLLPTIDEIAQEKKRRVLLLSFPGAGSKYSKNPVRKYLLSWLELAGIPFQECGDDPSISGYSSYQGEIFVDVECHSNDEDYKRLTKFLIGPDDDSRFTRIALSFHSP
ncbi:hypothetical protein GJ700_17735 [Duganella sp. FT92W]|uniref:Uncharacterized protein n=1 Tax=Pseudoduganella rivuli TaxID=2666085 RepID=A0A7X2IP19_9BURK|nr:hypothetical protein [Pseudoduganella rivuli]MRV73557.1 hypothetical protein [Pseudoduganella rivuli]